jgi:hypothetical protein
MMKQTKEKKSFFGHLNKTRRGNLTSLAGTPLFLFFSPFGTQYIYIYITSKTKKRGKKKKQPNNEKRQEAPNTSSSPSIFIDLLCFLFIFPSFRVRERGLGVFLLDH